MRSGRLRAQSGQIFPILLVAMVAIIAVAMVLFQIGSATELKAQGQTGADASALAAAKSISDQVIAADGSFDAIDEAQVQAAAADYAGRNASQILSVKRDGCAVTVQVRTLRTLEGRQAEEAEVEGRYAVASARAEMTGFGVGGAVPVFDGEMAEHLRPVAALAASFGLQVTSANDGHHASGSLHYQNLALDVAGGAGGMAAFYNAAKERYDGQILELFYDPLGGIDDNVEIGAIGQHGDHVHIAVPPSATAGADDDDDEDESEDDEEGSEAGGERDEESDDDSGSDDADLDLDGGTFGSGGGGAKLIPLDQESKGGCTGLLAGGGGVPGFGDGNFSPDTSSIKIGQAVCRVGEALNVSDKVMLAAFETAIVESGARNLPKGHLDSAGVFQQRPSQGWGSYNEVTDVNYAATQFFTRAKRAESSGQSAGQLSQSVQRSAFGYKYDQNRGGALRLMETAGCRT